MWLFPDLQIILKAHFKAHSIALRIFVSSYCKVKKIKIQILGKFFTGVFCCANPFLALSYRLTQLPDACVLDRNVLTHRNPAERAYSFSLTQFTPPSTGTLVYVLPLGGTFSLILHQGCHGL